MIVRILDVVIAGLLMGGIYALIAVGLSLQYGVARVLNIAHGEFIMLVAFITWSLHTIFGINPLVSLAVCGPFVFIIGFFLSVFVSGRLVASLPPEKVTPSFFRHLPLVVIALVSVLLF